MKYKGCDWTSCDMLRAVSLRIVNTEAETETYNLNNVKL